MSEWDLICRRAGGRRHYNAVRQANALQRRAIIVHELAKSNFQRGLQVTLAKRFGVSEATISRDMQILLQTHTFCPCCGAMRLRCDE